MAQSTCPAVVSSSTQPQLAEDSLRAAHSENEAERYLLLYLNDQNPGYDLRLTISEEVLFSKAVHHLLKVAWKRRQRFSYDRETEILKIFALSRPLQDVIVDLVTEFKGNAVSTGFIKPEEKDYIRFNTTGVMLSRTHTKMTVKKPQAWTKYPDAVLFFGGAEEQKVPRVVFEVGFAESYDDLVADAHQWLKRTRDVGLVVLINIKENISVRNVRQKQGSTQRRIKSLVSKYGSDAAKLKYGLNPENSNESDPELYGDIGAEIVAEDWVGPMSVKLELWELQNGTPAMRQPEFTILPAPSAPQNPEIHITDLIPEDKRGLFDDFDDSRTYELDMDLYRRLLISGISSLAFQRAITQLRSHQDADSAYPP